MLAALLLGCSAENAVDDSGVEACSDGESLVYVMNTISCIVTSMSFGSRMPSFERRSRDY